MGNAWSKVAYRVDKTAKLIWNVNLVIANLLSTNAPILRRLASMSLLICAQLTRIANLLNIWTILIQKHKPLAAASEDIAS